MLLKLLFCTICHQQLTVESVTIAFPMALGEAQCFLNFAVHPGVSSLFLSIYPISIAFFAPHPPSSSHQTAAHSPKSHPPSHSADLSRASVLRSLSRNAPDPPLHPLGTSDTNHSPPEISFSNSTKQYIFFNSLLSVGFRILYHTRFHVMDRSLLIG